MKRALPLGLFLLLIGALILRWGKAEAAAVWWGAPGLTRSAQEPEFTVLAAPTGPVGAAAVNPQDPQIIYLGGAAGLYRSTDGGEGWTLWSLELLYPHTLLVDPQEPDRLYAARRDLASFLPLPGVYASTDGGRTWRRFSAGLGEERIFSLALDPFHAGTLYAGSWAGRVYRSVDRGEHWQLASEEPVRSCRECAPGTVGQLLVHPLDGALYAGEANAGTFRSTDGGATWSQVNRDSGWLAVDPEQGDLYIAGRRLYRSSDGGRTWTDLSAGLPYNPRTGTYVTLWVGVNPDPPALYTRYHRSTDGGTTWEALDTPAGFVPRLLLPGSRPVIYGSLNGQAGRYTESPWGTP